MITKQLLIEAAHCIPFLGMVIPSHETSPLLTRLLEAGIIGAVIMYGVQNVQAEKIDSIKQDLQEIKQQTQQFNNDILNVRLEIERLKVVKK